MTIACEIRDSGDDSNAGFFDDSLGGTDYTLQTAAQASGTASSSGTTVTATTGIFTSAMVGNYITDGTVYVKITAFTSSTVVTVNTAPTWTSASVRVGGALASPGKASYIAMNYGVSPSILYLKYRAASYDITTATLGANGPVVLSYYDGNMNVYLIGYDTTRTPFNTDANRPTIKATGGVSYGMVRSDDRYTLGGVHNIIADANNRTGVSCFTTVGNNALRAWNCKALNASDTNCYGFLELQAWYCEAENCYYGFNDSSGGFGGTYAIFGCIARNCSNTGFLLNYMSAYCIATGCGVGFSCNGFLCNCVAYNSTSHGFTQNYYSGGPHYFNCIAVNNGGYGFVDAGYRTGTSVIVSCATYGNTSGALYGYSGIGQKQNNVTLTASPFTNAASEDFSLNNTAGGGAACRAAGFPGTYPGGTTTGYLDIGAVQHQDSGGGGGMGVLIGSGGLIR